MEVVALLAGGGGSTAAGGGGSSAAGGGGSTAAGGDGGTGAGEGSSTPLTWNQRQTVDFDTRFRCPH